MLCNFCRQPANMTVRDNYRRLYNCCQMCLDGFRQKKGEPKYRISVVYKEGI